MLFDSNFLKSKKILKVLGITFFGFFLLGVTGCPYPSFVRAEEVNANALSVRRAELERQLAQYEKQIGELNGVIKDKQNQSATLQRDIDILNANIKKAKLGIQSLDIEINRLQGGIKEKATLVGTLERKIENENASLSELIRKYDEMNAESLVTIIFGYEKISDFFHTVDELDSLQGAIQNSLDEIRGTKVQTEKEIDTLEVKKAEQLQIKTLQNLQKKKLESAQKEEADLLKKTKGQETEYQKLLKNRQAEASKIRSQLFLLNGSSAIPFEKALEYANLAYKNTGVRQAFLLGIMTEESNLGQNVGTGDWKTDLAHAKCATQRTAFVEITTELGLNPDLMPVSKKAWYGYCGGAMGPAQFIPTTWKLYKKGVTKITGNNPPNPWNPIDAFVASALLLKDNGGAGGNYEKERIAALKYLAGSNWKTPSYAFYADDVLGFATKYQEQIDLLNQLASR